MQRKTRTDIVADIGFVLLVIALVVLKLTNVIPLSWFWLSAIIWIPLCIGLALITILIITCLVKDIINIIRRNIK